MALLPRTLTVLSRLAALCAVVCLGAFIAGCDDASSASVAKVAVGGKTFHLEIVAEPKKRYQGLSGRTHIEPDGGMIFVFPQLQPAVNGFVMRDCPIPIDIIYLDAQGRILAWHEMTPVDPRAADGSEGKPGPDSSAPTPENKRYEARLKQYTSRFPYQFAVELAGGTIKSLNLREGDKADFDAEGLKKRAR